MAVWWNEVIWGSFILYSPRISWNNAIIFESARLCRDHVEFAWIRRADLFIIFNFNFELNIQPYGLVLSRLYDLLLFLVLVMIKSLLSCWPHHLWIICMIVQLSVHYWIISGTVCYCTVGVQFMLTRSWVCIGSALHPLAQVGRLLHVLTPSLELCSWLLVSLLSSSSWFYSSAMTRTKPSVLQNIILYKKFLGKLHIIL